METDFAESVPDEADVVAAIQNIDATLEPSGEAGHLDHSMPQTSTQEDPSLKRKRDSQEATETNAAAAAGTASASPSTRVFELTRLKDEHIACVLELRQVLFILGLCGADAFVRSVTLSDMILNW